MSEGGKLIFKEKVMRLICIRFIVLCLIAIGSFKEVVAAENIKVYFRFDKTIIEASYSDNEASLQKILHNIDSLGVERIDSIQIVGLSSPEGVYRYNLSLAQKRANALQQYLVEKRPQVKNLIRVSIQDDLWTALREQILQDSGLSEKDKQAVVSIIDANVGTPTKNWRLRRLPIYNYLVKNHFTKLRQAAYASFYLKEPETKAVEKEPVKETFVPKDNAYTPADTVKQQEPVVPEPTQEPPLPPRKELFFLRSNLLLPLGNIGVEVPIGTRWSVGADYYFPWLKRKDNHKSCTQALMWNLEGRYWLGNNRKMKDILEGHSIGFNTMFGYYDLERNYKGYQGDFVNFSVDYTYGLPIFKDKLHLEFTIGLGYFFSKAERYDVFEEGGKGYRKGYKENFRMLGPNKIAISVVVPISKAGRNEP